MYCKYCETEKSDSEFSFRNKNKGTRNKRCKDCQNIYSKAHYQANKGKHNARRYANQQKYVERNQKFIREHLNSNPCVDCGETDIVVLEFDHIRDKEYNISDMIQSGMSIEKISSEIEKCQVRCANCHRRKTAKQFGYHTIGV